MVPQETCRLLDSPKFGYGHVNSMEFVCQDSELFVESMPLLTHKQHSFLTFGGLDALAFTTIF